MLGQLCGGQAIRAEQPAVVSDDLHRTPTGIEQFLDAEGQPFDFACNDTRQIVLQLVAAVIEVADFQPSPCFWAVWDVELVVR